MVSPQAELGSNVQVGPFAVIAAGTIVGAGSEIMSHAHIYEHTTIGRNCKIHQSAAVGNIPQDISFDGSETYAVIGDNTTIREFVTINRGTQDTDGRTTRVGSNTLIMAYVHLGHDTSIGDNCIIANSVQTGGHVIVHDWVGIGAITPVHQYCHIGTHAFVGGGLRVAKDVPPYIIAMGEPLKFAGLNVVGLKRRGFTSGQRAQIKQAYRLIYRSELNVTQALEAIRNELELTPEIEQIIVFIESSERGIV